ncbi:MAG: serine/threonine protein kinase [Ruminococcaceae bacterium]|nr:serine/threonine protein kinase [Oscillospiraceae bacterium]
MTCGEYLMQMQEKYQIIKILSKKNGGQILLMRHKTLEKDIVVRCYPKPIEAYNKLKNYYHPNIAVVFDSFLLDDGQIVLEEYVDGITVNEVLQSGCYKYRGAKKIITDVGNALIDLHRMNIIHRDIKPENIIIDKNGCAKLIDFNASRLYTTKTERDTEVLGTVGYASPEQFGISQSGEKSDIYSLGVLLNVMLTGKHPSDSLAKGKAGRIVLKCTQIDPNSRFKTVEKLLMKL